MMIARSIFPKYPYRIRISVGDRVLIVAPSAPHHGHLATVLKAGRSFRVRADSDGKEFTCTRSQIKLVEDELAKAA